MGKSAGKIMPLPRGAYDGNATYNILDMVTLDNKLWIAKKSGITGIEPSKTAPEWMMAVDGTTDVKGLETEVEAKFASIDEQFLAKDTQISGLNTRVTAAEGSITSLGGRCDEIDGKFVFDTKPTKDSTNLLTSGGIYDMLNKHEKMVTSEDGSYQVDASSAGAYGQSAEIDSAQEQYYTASMTGGALRHVEKYAAFRAHMGEARIYVSKGPKSDNADTASAKNISLLASFYANRFQLDFSEDGADSTYLNFRKTSVSTQDSGTYDIGTSDEKFRNIYATTGTIQTSDKNEKENIECLDVTRAHDIIMGLNPVTYKFIDGTSDRTHYGLIAQDVEKTINELGIDNKDFAALIKNQKVIHRTEKKQVGINENGEAEYIESIVDEPVEGEYTYGLRYDEFIAILIKMCQNLQNEVNELKVRLGGE